MVECYPVTGRNGILIHIPFATWDKPDSKGLLTQMWTIPSMMPVVGQKQDRGMGAGQSTCQWMGVRAGLGPRRKLRSLCAQARNWGSLCVCVQLTCAATATLLTDPPSLSPGIKEVGMMPCSGLESLDLLFQQRGSQDHWSQCLGLTSPVRCDSTSH